MRSILVYSLISISFVTYFACTSGETKEPTRLDKTKASFEENKSKSTASLYIGEIQKEAIQNSGSKAEGVKLLDQGMALAKEYNLMPQETSLLYSKIKMMSEDADPEDIFGLATRLKALGKVSASDVLYHGYINNTEGQSKDEATAQLSAPIANIDTFINSIRTSMFDNPTKFGLNEINARKYVDACEAYGMVYTESTQAPVYLFNGAEVAKTLRSFNKSFGLFDWIIDKYPNHPKAATSLFLKGFIMENEVKNVDQARELYNEFITKHPNHELRDDVQFLIDNLGKSDEEILKMIEQKRDEKSSGK